MHEIVVISGKGGTGKTTITGAFAAIVKNKVIADCDVDAADLHLLLKPEVKESQEFWCGQVAYIDRGRCMECNLCTDICRFNAIHNYVVDPIACEGCGFCARVCAVDAISMDNNLSGHIYKSATKYGSFVHARLGIAQENSGKLVTQVRQMAKDMAKKESADYLICDGSPGIGCPVIASLIGVDLALVITEPTLSGIHDMERVIEVCQKLDTGVVVAINKYDINEANSRQIESYCQETGIKIIGKIPYDISVNKALANGKTIAEYPGSKACSEIEKIWHNLTDELEDKRLASLNIGGKGE